MHALVILERASKGPLLAGEKGDVDEQGFPAQLRSLMSFAEAHLLTRQGGGYTQGGHASQHRNSVFECHRQARPPGNSH